MGLILECSPVADAALRAAAGQAEATAQRAATSLGDLGFSRDLDAPREWPPPVDADRVVVLGLGGSALGTRTVHTLAGSEALPCVVVDNVDPELFESAWRGGTPARTHWVLVSKSGGTAETLALGGLVLERIENEGGTVSVATGARGPLRDLAEDRGFPVFSIPEAIGGRFSVFTPAATLPLALAGLDTDALLRGARRARDAALQAPSLAARLAGLLVAAERAGRNVVAIWAYGERLEPFAEWFRQLWAESLGKIRADGSRAGQTPVVCIGSTDQHSMQQLMVEGPPDKVALVVSGPPTGDAHVPPGLAGDLANHGLSQVLDAMRRATAAAMADAGCPVATLRLGSWDLETAGELLFTMMAATVLAGGLLEVDPFGQPGVEAAKILARELLAGREGVEGRVRSALGEGEGLTL